MGEIIGTEGAPSDCNDVIDATEGFRSGSRTSGDFDTALDAVEATSSCERPPLDLPRTPSTKWSTVTATSFKRFPKNPDVLVNTLFNSVEVPPEGTLGRPMFSKDGFGGEEDPRDSGGSPPDDFSADEIWMLLREKQYVNCSHICCQRRRTM
jgi:hypothetical protein